MTAIDNTPLIEFLDALKVLTRHLWPNGGIDYDVQMVTGDVNTAFENNQNNVYGQETPDIDREDARVREFAKVFAHLLERVIDARSESLGVKLAGLLSEPYIEPSLRFTACWDDHTWALSVVNTNSKRPYLLNATFQYD